MRVHDQIDGASVCVDPQRMRPGAARVDRLENTAHLGWRPEIPQCRDISDVGILRIDNDAADRAAVLEANVRPSGAAIDRAIDAITPRATLPVVLLTSTRPQNIRIRWRHRDHAEGGGRLLLEDGHPGRAVVARLP